MSVTKPFATVVHIITQLELGGAQEITLFTCRNLNRERFRVHLIAGRGGLLDGDAERIPGLTVHFLEDLVRPVRPALDARCLATLTRLLRSLRAHAPGPMIVHTHSSKAGILGRWAAYRSGVPIRMHTIHGFGFHRFQPYPIRRVYEAAEQVTARVTHAFAADSEANLRDADRLGLLRGGKPAIALPCWFEQTGREPTADEGRALRREFGIPPEAPLVAMVACLKPQKAPVDFVRVAERVAAEHPEAHFLIAGDGVLRPLVEAEIEARGLSARFHLLGWRRDVERVFAALDVLVLTSLWEGLPRVIPQAMEARKPIVATCVDGVPEAVEDGRTGFLLEPRDVEGIAERVGRLTRDRKLARDLGEEGHRRLARFDAWSMLAEQESFYENLLAAA